MVILLGRIEKLSMRGQAGGQNWERLGRAAARGRDPHHRVVIKKTEGMKRRRNGSQIGEAQEKGDAVKSSN